MKTQPISFFLQYFLVIFLILRSVKIEKGLIHGNVQFIGWINETLKSEAGTAFEQIITIAKGFSHALVSVSFH